MGLAASSRELKDVTISHSKNSYNNLQRVSFFRLKQSQLLVRKRGALVSLDNNTLVTADFLAINEK